MCTLKSSWLCQITTTDKRYHKMIPRWTFWKYMIACRLALSFNKVETDANWLIYTPTFLSFIMLIDISKLVKHHSICNPILWEVWHMVNHMFYIDEVYFCGKPVRHQSMVSGWEHAFIDGSLLDFAAIHLQLLKSILLMHTEHRICSGSSSDLCPWYRKIGTS